MNVYLWVPDLVFDCTRTASIIYVLVIRHKSKVMPTNYSIELFHNNIQVMTSFGGKIRNKALLHRYHLHDKHDLFVILFHILRFLLYQFVGLL